MSTWASRVTVTVLEVKGPYAGLSESLLPMVATVPVRGDDRSSRHKTCKFAPVP